MNSRERVLKTIQFEGPDKIPVSWSLEPRAVFEHGQRLIDLCKQYPNDFADPEDIAKMRERDTQNYLPDGSYHKETTDDWGCVYLFLEDGIAGEVKGHPLADWADFNDYQIPNVPNSSPEERQKLKENMTKQKEKFIGWGSGGSLFVQMQNLRGSENFLMDIAEDREELYQLAERITDEYLIPTIEISLESGAEVVSFGDDIGTKDCLLISPDSWRRIFKPYYKKMFDIVNDAGAIVWMHSCGNIFGIVEDYIEIGVKVLNPQVEVYDMEALHKTAEDRLCIIASYDQMNLMPNGTPEMIHQHVKDLQKIFSKKSGGYMQMCGAIGSVPFENIEAYFEASFTYRDP